jgi:LPS-assembly lipoprotein
VQTSKPFPRRAARLAALGLAALLPACGFHLQDQAELPREMAALKLDIHDRYSPFARRLLILLEQNGVHVVDGDAATAILEIPVNSVVKEILTIGDNARVREYRIRHEVRFRLVDPAGRVLVAEQTLRQSRVISFDEQDILGAAQEEEFLRRNMADNLARLVIRRLGTAPA